MPKMKIKLRPSHVFMAFIFVLFSSTANAQSKINGTVTDAEAKTAKRGHGFSKGNENRNCYR